MFSSIDIIKVLDHLRANQRIKIQDLVDGIMSRKKYTRLLNDETSISFSELLSLLDKMSIPLQNFSQLVTQAMESHFVHEQNFYLALLRNNYKEAKEDYYPKLDINKRYSALGQLGLKALVELIYFKTNKQTILETRHHLHELKPLDDILLETIIQDGMIAHLYAYVHVATEAEKRRIASYVFKAVYDNKYRYYIACHKLSKVVFYLTGILAYTTINQLSKEERGQLEKLALSTIRLHLMTKNRLLDYNLFAMLYYYQQKLSTKNNYITFYYLESYISLDEAASNLPKLEVTKEDIDIFKQFITQYDRRKIHMYEGILANEKIW